MNIADLIDDNAVRIPDRKAIVFPIGDGIYEHYTFRVFHQRCNQYANYLRDLGIKETDKVLLFVKPSLDFSVLVFALFKIGAIPVFMDPGMGRKNLLKSIEQCAPDIMIASWEVHLIKLFYSKHFKNIRTFIKFGSTIFGSIASFNMKALSYPSSFENLQVNKEKMGAILFTSGGTGAPKGVVYTQEILKQQTLMLKEMFSLTPFDVDLPGFPLFSLFTLAIGMSSCIPDMNPSKPAKVDARKLVDNILENSVTFAAGSPAIWDRVADFCIEERITLPSVKYLVMFGAPVNVELHERLKKILPFGTSYTPYGATECLPISNISGEEILKNYKTQMLNGNGTCVGTAAPGVEIKIIKTDEGIIDSFSAIEEMATGKIGEIIISSSTVTPKYYLMDEKTSYAKIYDGDKIWHRMGDLGYLDKEMNLWFCGRKTHRVELENETLYSIPVESIFNQHSDVKRSALIKVSGPNGPKAALVVERRDKKVKLSQELEDKFKRELKELSKSNKGSQNVEDFFFHSDFPVDGRHNIKIDRLRLAQEYRGK